MDLNGKLVSIYQPALSDQAVNYPKYRPSITVSRNLVTTFNVEPDIGELAQGFVSQ